MAMALAMVALPRLADDRPPDSTRPAPLFYKDPSLHEKYLNYK